MIDKTKIVLPKADYSETVVRKTLYWMSEVCHWQLDSVDEDWVVYLDAGNDGLGEFHRILNDFILREKLDVETKNLRMEIINAALTRLGSGAK